MTEVQLAISLAGQGRDPAGIDGQRLVE
jgi:hypothetical protein